MTRTLALALGALMITGAAHAGSSTKFEAAITVDRNAVSSAAQLKSIEQQAIAACRYEETSVLANMYDKACARDLVEQTLAQLNNAALNQAYAETNRATS
ncbi:MAG: hypothetical protein CMK09_16810 [Ponticaulis sp.]|nr:hypothetical protein [Ponticaulis sp.]|tara:strand:- start:6608 stop:6907 length:300 start_codon:yes stop_codon:yes gene_type:complete